LIKEVLPVQRLSTLATLFVLMFILSWVAFSMQREYEQPRLHEHSNSLINRLSLPEEQPPPELISVPSRNGAESLEGEMPRVLILDNLEEEKNTAAGTAQHHGPDENENDLNTTSKPDCIHFLLLGSEGSTGEVKLLLVNTLVTGREARLTAIDPAIPVLFKDKHISLGMLLKESEDYGVVCQAVAQASGLTPQFYIDLKLEGFSEMVELLGGIEHEGGTAAVTTAELNRFTGPEILKVLKDPQIDTSKKEALIIDMLLTAREVDNTSLGLALLWTGYRNLKTNLGLKDLLEVRKVTQGISPTTVSFSEIKHQ
jgi:hypothetical protein